MSMKSDMANAVVSRVSDKAKDAVKNKVNDVASGKNNEPSMMGNNEFSTGENANNDFSDDGQNGNSVEGGLSEELSELKDAYDEQKQKSKEEKKKKEKEEKSDKDSKDADKKDDKSKNNSAGKKMQKAGAAFAAGGAAVKATLMMQFMMYLKMFLQMLMAMLQAVISAVVGLISTIVSMVVTAVTALAALIGVSVMVATMGVAGVAVLAVMAVVGFVSWLSGSDNPGKYDSLVQTNCASAYFQSSEFDKVNVDEDEEALANAQSIYSFFSEWGMPDEQIAGILGNWYAESGIDPTSVETIYDEPYQLGEKKLKAMECGFKIEEMDADYSNRFPKIVLCGIGLGQWTDTTDGSTRHTKLRAFADKAAETDSTLGWYSLDVQLAFAVSEDSRATWLSNWREESFTSPEDAAKDFCTGWEGITWGASATHASQRKEAASKYYALMADWEADVDYANSIITMAGTVKTTAADRKKAKDVDDCISINKVNNSSIATAAVQFAYLDKEDSRNNNGTPLWQALHDGIFPGDTYYMACCRTVSVAVRWSGADDQYPAGGVAVQRDYLTSDAGKIQWKEIDWNGDVKKLEPGDILLKKDSETSHTIIYVGVKAVETIYGKDNEAIIKKYGTDYKDKVFIVHGSLNDRSPALDVMSESHHSYRVFRNIRKEDDSKFKDIGVSISVKQSQ